MDAAVEVFAASVANVLWRSTPVWLVGYAGPFRRRCSFPPGSSYRYARIRYETAGKSVERLLCPGF